jgi:3'-phosphoadenosine 5'-phosphosulfate sulfotransferase (PAPS reductase)/FAD synthetase
LLHIVALSGGKDSTALALRLKELNPAVDYTYVCTPTGDELPEMEAHWQHLEVLLGKPLIRLHAAKDLNGLIEQFNALPNFRQRWCTRMLKIVPIIAFYKRNPGSVVYIGLRADEEERKGGIFGDLVDKVVYPLREWGWTKDDVWAYLRARGQRIPTRTDCARCYHQRIGEWWRLWKMYPEIWADAERQEIQTGHTFRSPGRDTWPVALVDLRAAFESGRIPKGADEAAASTCRVCTL